ncbi:hypothetical protein RhiirA4_472596 [Rhizophagus irregularis]|uniref:Uncharacterized protein n=1 Tax=Rhizophagus irregularis TaxID=588596 RepID=A0A2I1H594_9GLOM|nr:hypothetical protein RhiirA4_472596 [Rhizophagus irregularis]
MQEANEIVSKGLPNNGLQETLNLNPRNIWTVNEITVVLAETERMQEANESFWKIFNINYAHICALLGNYSNAIQKVST